MKSAFVSGAGGFIGSHLVRRLKREGFWVRGVDLKFPEFSVDECVEGTIRLMRSDFSGPVNIGSEEMVTINGLARMVMRIAVKDLSVRNIPGPTGVRGRNSDNRLTRDRLGWAPSQALADGLAMTYRWIERQVLRNAA